MTGRTASNPLTRLPQDVRDRAAALLAERGVRRPVGTLPFLVQEVLRWRTLSQGLPSFEPRSLNRLARDFRAAAFDLQPAHPRRWRTAQLRESEALFQTLAVLVAEGPALPLPPFPAARRPRHLAELLGTAWNHLDRHLAALSLGLLDGGLLASSPEDPAFETQASLREGMLQPAGALVPLLEYLDTPRGAAMPAHQAHLALSALLDALGEHLDKAFDAGGTRGRWLARAGGWERPEYPCGARELPAALRALPPGAPS